VRQSLVSEPQGGPNMDENVIVEEFSVETLIEDVSIDGMCGVY
jgi:mycofactocin precursor